MKDIVGRDKRDANLACTRSERASGVNKYVNDHDRCCNNTTRRLPG